MLLSEDDMIELTHAEKPSVQSRVLDENGIFYVTRRDKTIVTTWHHVNNPIKYLKQANDSEPDFTAIK